MSGNRSEALGDFPANPMDKPGYLLEFHDEFSRPGLDDDKWIPFHLPQWSSRAQAAARTGFEGGHLVLRIDADQPPWCPEYDGDVRVSSLQTGLFCGPAGSLLGQHRFNPACVVREAQPRQAAYVPMHGFFELRAKGVKTPGNHAALWMIGYEDAPGNAAEICICELFGQDAGAASSTVRFGLHPFSDTGIVDDFRSVRLPIDVGDFHVYAAEWTPRRIHFYVDNQDVGVVEQSPRYPMQFMLGLYERPQEARGGDAHPKRFVIDYFRAYRPIGGYRDGA